MTSLRNPFMAHADISKHLPSHKGRKVFNLSGDQIDCYETGYLGDHPTPANDNLTNMKSDFGLCGKDFMYVPTQDRRQKLSELFDEIAPGGKMLLMYRTVGLDEGMHPISIGEMNDIARDVVTEQNGFYSCPAAIDDPMGRKTDTGEPYRWYQCLMHKI